MFIEDLNLTKKHDILLMDDIGEIIKRHLEFDPSIRKLKLKHYEISQITQKKKTLLKYTFFFSNGIKEFLADDYHIVEIVNNKIKNDDVLNSNYNLFMCRNMYKRLGNNSYFENLLINLNDNEKKTFDKRLQMESDLVDLFKYYESKNNWEN